MGKINEEYISVENLKHESFAPIVLFVYNRPWHTQQTVEALQKNVYAAESELIIYADAAKNAQAEEKVQEVREYIKSITGFKSVKIIEQKTNQGLANSIINGVTEVVDKYGRIIVLEDDIVTSKWFLKYMNDALEVYKEEEKVMQVSGYTYPVDNSDLPETFFLPLGECWGWGTWSRAWKFFERKPLELLESSNQEYIRKFNFDNSHMLWEQVVRNSKGQIVTWAVFFHNAIIKNNGLTCFSKTSMTNNIGHDNSGMNCVNDNSHYTLVADNQLVKLINKVDIDERIINKHKEYFSRYKKNILERILKKILTILRGNI